MSTRTSAWRERPWSITVGVALFGLAVAVPLLRQRGHAPWQTMWAEDGEIYYRQAKQGGLSSTLRGYDGYVQAVSRVVILPARLVPLERVPMYVALASAFVGAVLALLVYRWSAGFIASRACRLALAAMHVVAPSLGWEGAANIAWLIYLWLPVVPWAIVAQQREPFDVVLRAGVVFVGVLSHVLAAAFVPLALVMAWRRRTRADSIVAAAMCIGLLLQLGLMAFASPRHGADPLALGELLGLITVQVLGSFLLGEAPLKSLWLDWGWSIAVVFVLATAVILVLALVSTGPRSRRRGLVWFGYAAVIVVLSLAANGTATNHLVEGVAPAPIQRYVAVPVLLLVGSLFMMLDSADERRATRDARVGRGLLLAQLTVVVVTSFRITNLRSTSPLWFEQLKEARASCAAPSATSAKLAIAPDGWFVEIDCAELRDA